jgi:hypothetical protein
MINLARLGAVLFFTLVSVVPAFCQDEPVKPVGERLDEVRATMDEAYANIATLQQHLNNATDAKDESRIEKLREEIDYAWTEIERLKSLEEMLLDLKEKEAAVKDGRPRRAVGGGRREFDNDTSSGSNPPRNSGFVMDDGTTGDPFRNDTSTGERPRRAMPGGEKENELGPPPRRPKSQERPVRAGGPVQSPAGAGQPGAPLTSKKLTQLQASYDSLIEAGETKLAEKVLKSIETEKQRLLKEAKEQAEREGRNNREPRGEQQPGRNGGGGGGLASTEPAAGSGGKSKEELIRELEDLIRQLQEENRELRDKKDNDK